jgi:nitrate reductase gamma subunit
VIEVVASCTQDVVGPCEDTGTGGEFLPLWVIVVGAVLVLAAVTALLVLVLRRAARRAPWE